MAITNCSIPTNLQTFVNDGGSAIGTDVAELIIVPDAGYTIRASSFTNNTGTQTWLSSIALTDTDTTLTGAVGYVSNTDTYYPYGTVANTVKITVTLNPLYTMPNADTTLTIDIDDFGEYGGGQRNVISIYLEDIHDVVSNTTVNTVEGTGITATASTTSGVTTTIHSGDIVGDVQTTLFTKTFVADSGYYYMNPPEPTLYVGLLASRYDLTYVDTLNVNGEVTQRVWTVKYTGDTNITIVDQHKIVWSGNGEIPAVGTTYTKSDTIDTFTIERSSEYIDLLGESRTVTVTGTPGAGFNFTVAKHGEIGASAVTDETYDFSTNLFTQPSTTSGNLTIPATGIYTTTIVFPVVTADDSYGLDIAKVGSTTLSATVPQASPDIALYQYYTDLTITVGVDSPVHKIGGRGVVTYGALPSNVDFTTRAGYVKEGQTTYTSFSFVVNTNVDYEFPAADTFNVFNNRVISNTNSSDNGGTVVTFSKLVITRTTVTRITLTGIMEVIKTGNIDVTCLIDLDEIIPFLPED